MKNPNRIRKDLALDGVCSLLRGEAKSIFEKCINCELCKKECKFLRKYGKPKNIVESYNPSNNDHEAVPFECSLCQLCAAVCPVDVNPGNMFLEMRRELVNQGNGEYPEYSTILGYERRGTSRRYTYYAIPAGCDTIFFPGCTLQGTRPDKTLGLFEYMKKEIPALGIVLDCCTKPSHDLGRQDYFNAMFHEMKGFLIRNGVRNVLVACPSCYEVFRKNGGQLSVRTVYEFMVQNGLPNKEEVNGTVTIHDPCVIRWEEAIHSAVRDLCTRKGLTIEEMPHHGKTTMCCGEGGAVGCVSPHLANKWGALIKKEANGRRIVTYCAGCANLLGAITPTSHVLDVLFEPETTLSGKAKVSKSPVTYLNRLRLKNRLKNTVNAPVTRERTFTGGEAKKKGTVIKRVFFLLAILTAILAVRFTGVAHYLEQETLRQWIQGYGTLAPVVYMLIYTVAPAFFLPGLPITIVGGVLFGPFWGVVYTITGATSGACVAFIISRHIAREWIEEKLKSPKWQRLDQGVERHGWKVVAFTRLIPLFPFNLLNYAFGLTKIKFLHYAITTFICMLPACIAYVVFSSSLLDVIKGRMSPAFIAGMGLIVLVSSVPLFWRRYKAKRGMTDLL